MSLLEDVFSLTKKEQIALLEELEKKASAPSPIALPQEVIETFELPDEIDIEDELAKIKEIVLAEIQSVTINAPKGDKGDKGDKGAVGPQGPKGADGVAGKDGKQGVDGKDGIDGISVTDARVDFDGSLVITLSNGQEINAGDVIPNDKKDLIIQSLKNSTLSLTELGIEDYLSSPTPIGDVTPNTGAFTSLTTPSVTATTNDLTLSAISTGNFNVNTPNGTAFRVLPVSATSSNWLQVGNPSTTVIRLGPAGTTVADFRILAPTFTSFHTGSSADGLSDGSNQMRVSHTASAVNYVQVTGGATGTYPAILGTGSDGTVGLQLAGKGGTIDFRNNGIGTATQFSVAFTASSVNYLNATGSGVSGNAPRLFALGTDTNISMAFQPKGTGAINLAAGSRGVNISNGGTVTAVTLTNAGTGYTSFPTATISVPTTAGGVQGVVSFTRMYPSGYTIGSGGTGYTVGNVLTIVGGTPVTTAAQLTVSSVSGGVITAVTVSAANSYTVLPTSPVSVTGGSGTGATFNLTYSLGAATTISNAGSGYIEQPTVTFSGGGGSGAAAYAVIGNTTITRGLASVSTFHSPSGETLRLSESGGTSVVGLNITNGSSNQNTVYMYPHGSAVNPNTILGSKGTGFVGLFTGSNNDSNGTQQFRVAHTASAVNYVQVTGSTTGNFTAISAQGSDTNVSLSYISKGTGQHIFATNSSSGNGQFRVLHTAGTIANYGTVTGNVTGSAPIFSVAGTDTNIDLALTPKGTGLVRFGTYVAGALLATGYINIKAADGTTYKVLVST